jgi:hypothetical protein
MPLFDLFWAMLWLFLWIAWIWLLVSVLFDIFRSHDLGGWGKALWALFVVILPFLGVFIYLIARGGQMQQRSIDQANAQEAATADYVRSVADSGSSADELAKLSNLRDQGAIDDDEYKQMKAKVLNS